MTKKGTPQNRHEAPQPPLRYIPRTALYEVFDAAFHKSVVCAWAPAGYGKSVSAALWLRARGLCHAWVALDLYDDVPWLFYRRFCNALAVLWPKSDAPSRVFDSPGFRDAPVEHAMEAAFSLPPAVRNRRRILVLDDLHLLSNAEILASLPLVLQKLPEDTSVLLLGRSGLTRDMFRAAAGRVEQPAPDGSQPRGWRGMTEIGPEDLRFSSQEAGACLAAFGRSATDVYERTEGWPIAVAAYATQLAAGEEETPGAGTGGQELLDRCIRMQMWEPLDATAKDFLLRTCIAPTLTPSLCARLCGMSEGAAQAALTAIAHQSLLTGISGTGHTHHHLFRDFLRARLDEAVQRNELDCDMLYAAAADFHLDAGDFYQAIRYALRSGRDDALEPALQGIFRHDVRNNSVAHHAEKIGTHLAGVEEREDVLDAHPYLYLALAWHRHLVGDAPGLFAILDCLHERLPKILKRHPDFHRRLFFVAIVDHRLPWEAVQRTMGCLPEGIETPEDLPTQAKNLPFHHKGSHDYATFPGLPEDQSLLRAFFGSITGYGYQAAEAAICAGLQYERNRLAQALPEAEQSVILTPDGANPERAFFARMLPVAVLDAMERPEEARAKRTALRRDLEAIGGYFLFPNLDAYEAKLRLQEGDVGAAHAWLGNYFVSAVIAPGPDGKPRRLELFRIFQHLTTARALMVAGDPADARAFLERTVRLAADFRRVTDRAEALALLAILEWHRGKRDVAAPLLEEAILFVQPYRYIRVFADEGAAIMPILKRLAGRTVQPGYAGDLDPALLSEIRLAVYVRAKARLGIAAAMAGRPAKLTKRQREILLCLAKGLGRRETAASTGLSYENVKAHTAALYRAMGVASAADAALRARELGLIE